MTTEPRAAGRRDVRRDWRLVTSGVLGVLAVIAIVWLANAQGDPRVDPWADPIGPEERVENAP